MKDLIESLNRAHQLDESTQEYRWFYMYSFKTQERNYIGLWSNMTSKLYVITNDNKLPASDKKNWMFETTDYDTAKAKMNELAPQKEYPTGSNVKSLSDIQQFAGCDDFDWTDCTGNLKRSEKQKVLSIVTNNFTLPDGIIRVEWPVTAQRIAETLRLHYENVEIDNNYRVGYHKESAIFYDTPIQHSTNEVLQEASASETIYEDWDDVFCAIEDIIESCTIFGKHPYWFDAYIKPDRLILDIGVDDDETGRTGSHYEATLSNFNEVPTTTNELIKYVENLPWKANGETDVDDEYDLDDNM